MPAPSAEPGAPGSRPLTVALTKAGRTKIRYPAEPVRDDGTRITVRAPWAAPGSGTSASSGSSRVMSSPSTTGGTGGTR